MATQPEPDKTYVCPNCGQKAVIGAHFCQPFVPPPRPPVRKKAKRVQKVALWAFVATFVAVLFLWRWAGPASLVIVAVVLLLFLVWGQPRTGKGNHAKDATSSSGSGVAKSDRSATNKSDSKTSSSSPGKSKR